MAFTAISKGSGKGSHPAQGVAVGSHISGSVLKTRFRFAPDIMEAMGWAVGARLGLAFGDGKDAGTLRVASDDLCGFKVGRGGRGLSCVVQCAHIGNGKSHKSQSAPHKIRGGALYIELPKWARTKAA